MSKKPHAKPSTAGKEPAAVSDNDVVLNVEQRHKVFAEKTEENNREFVESFIKQMLSCKPLSSFRTMDILRLAYKCKIIFESQPRLIEVDAPVYICGDIHGQYFDLIRLFGQCGFPPERNYIFLGDYVDRGQLQIETILLIMAFKMRWPNNFFPLRGNHEQKKINELYGFANEMFNRKGDYWDITLNAIQEMMDYMPLVALVGGRILCMHGGISPKIKSLDTLRQIKCPYVGGEEGLESDILWSDPSPSNNGWLPNPRGCSVTFGENETKEMCKLLDIDLIVRAHQVYQDGFEILHGKRVVSVFSAPHYMGTFSNNAACCKVSAGLEVSIQVLKPEEMRIEEREATVEQQMSAETSQQP